MTPELHYLLYAIILGLAHLLATGMATTQQHGLKYSMSARDEQKPLIGKNARVVRAFQNFMQSFAFFAAAVLMTRALGIDNAQTQWGAALYFWARLAYIPLYVFGVPVFRSLVWFISFIGIALVLSGI